MATSIILREYSMVDHWKCLLSCSVVATTAFLYGMDIIIVDTLQAMPGFLEVRSDGGKLAALKDVVLKMAHLSHWGSKHSLPAEKEGDNNQMA